jgi:hypothetical protein
VQVLISDSIFLHLELISVTSTINFNDEIFLAATEVNDVRANGKLPMEFEAIELAITQTRPQTYLVRVSILTKLASDWR